MPEKNPDEQAAAAIRSAIKVGNFAENGVSFGKFKIKVVPAKNNFTAIWWTEDADGGPKGSPIAFYKYTGNTAPYLPLGDVVALESAAAWIKNGGQLWPVTGGGVMLFAPGDDAPDIFAHPTGFSWILDDKGSGNSHDVAYFRMNPPDGYEALGICFSDGDPDVNNYWCVKRKYLQIARSVEVWSDADAGWKSHDGNVRAPAFSPVSDPPPLADLLPNDIVILPPTFLSQEDLANETPFGLIGQQAALPVLPFNPPDPPYDPNIRSGKTTDYGVGPVAIVPYTAIPADAGFGEQAVETPFYFIASEPYWKCTETLSTPEGGSIKFGVTMGVSETQASSFTESTSMTIGCEVGAKFGDFSSKVTASFTQAFSLTTSESATHSTSKLVEKTVNFPKQPTTWIWDLQTQVAVFRNDGTQVSVAGYGNNDQRFVPKGIGAG
jgi:hypothetical protein